MAHNGVLSCFELIVSQMKEDWSVITFTQRLYIAPPPDVGLLYLWGAGYAHCAVRPTSLSPAL